MSEKISFDVWMGELRRLAAERELGFIVDACDEESWRESSYNEGLSPKEALDDEEDAWRNSC